LQLAVRKTRNLAIAESTVEDLVINDRNICEGVVLGERINVAVEHCGIY